MLYALASAECMVWYADVQFVSAEKPLRWFLWPLDQDAALRFLPFVIEPGQTFAQAFYACRLDEDKQPSSDYGQAEILAGRSYRQEYRCRQADGKVRWIAENVHVEQLAPGRWRAAGVCTDITQLKERESEIALLNERLQRAMTETHHRVKNNLQVIATMIEMQTADRPTHLPLSAFTRLSHHVRSLAVIHDLLTHQARRGAQTEAVSSRAMLEQLHHILQETAGARTIVARIDDTLLTSHQSAAIALVTAELVSNAVKHASGAIELTFTVDHDSAALSVRDHGQGLPAEFDLMQTANTGLELVHSLATWDLRGSFSMQNSPTGGVVATVQIRLETPHLV